VLHVGLGRLDQVGYEVVPPLELHVYLRERVFVRVARPDEPVIDGDGIDDHDDGEQHQAADTQ
jgi:hypothetical protein